MQQNYKVYELDVSGKVACLVKGQTHALSMDYEPTFNISNPIPLCKPYPKRVPGTYRTHSV